MVRALLHVIVLWLGRDGSGIAEHGRPFQWQSDAPGSPEARDPEEATISPTETPRSAHRSLDERSELGRAARAAVPRSAHGDWLPRADRADPIALLEAQNASRLPWLVPIRHARMAGSAFAFFRGAASVMAADLSSTPTTAVTVQLCGDAHLSNFGTYASPERQLVFDANDFDETLPGPFEWDLKRLVASIAICGRDRELPRRDVMEMCAFAVSTYRAGIEQFAALPVLDLWYRCLSIDALGRGEYGVVNKRQRREIERVTTEAHGHDNLQALRKLTVEVDGALRIRNAPPLLLSLHELDSDRVDREALLNAAWSTFDAYVATLADDRRAVLERFRPLDVGLKVVGVGSVGTRCFVLLLKGRDRDDPLFLQVKEATASVYEYALGPSRYVHHGRRVVEGQRLVQAVSDAFLGWTTGPEGRHYYVRQLRDWKFSVDLARATLDGLRNYAGICAWTIARGHARSGDAVALHAYAGTNDRLDRALTAFAQDYADQNAHDYDAFRAAIADGRIAAVE